MFFNVMLIYLSLLNVCLFQKAIDKVDSGKASANLCGLNKEKTFGERLETMQLNKTTVKLGNADFPVMTPP